jgi:DNA-binding NarL/FixJ family response regulator
MVFWDDCGVVNRPAPALALRDGDRGVLEKWQRSSSVSAGLAKRARIVLLAADGEANSRITAAVGASVNTVKAWRAR